MWKEKPGRGLLRIFRACNVLGSCLLALVVLIGCATLPENSNRLRTFAPTDTSETRLGLRVSQLISEGTTSEKDSGAVLLGNGLDAFAARLALTKEAESTIDAQYYMVHADLTGAIFGYHLIEVADRGVRVRLLIDDMDLAHRDEAMSALGQHPNIDLRIFNPFSRKIMRLWQYVSRLGSVTRRMHNKSFTVDNQVTIVGGRNIGNEYFNAHPTVNFGDLDMLAIGPVVREVSKSFDEYWNSEFAYPVDVLRPDLVGKVDLIEKRKGLEIYLAEEEVQRYLSQLRSNEQVRELEGGRAQFEWGVAEVFADAPEKLQSYRTTSDYSMAPALSPFFKDLKRELIIFSPYFVPGSDGTKGLCELSRSGVKVRILTNSLASTDVGIVHSGYSRYRRQLLRAGVELYEVNMKNQDGSRKEAKDGIGGSKASLHAKSFVLDREKVFVGSLNFDPRSIKENTEVGIMMSSKNIAEMMALGFEGAVQKTAFRLELQKDDNGLEYIVWHGLKNGEKHTWYHEPHTGFWNRFFIGMLGIIPFVESQL